MESQAQTPKLLDQVRNVLRLHHYSIHTERSYIDWIRSSGGAGAFLVSITPITPILHLFPNGTVTRNQDSHRRGNAPPLSNCFPLSVAVLREYRHIRAGRSSRRLVAARVFRPEYKLLYQFRTAKAAD